MCTVAKLQLPYLLSMKRICSISLKVALVFSSCLFLAVGGVAQERPNILWITCEDISPNIGCYGDQEAYTPNIDALAARGVIYSNAFASAPVCAVARSTIISGIYASSLGSQHMRCNSRRPDGQKLYPEFLREAGYFCTNNVKTDFNMDMDHKSIWDECSGDAHWRNRIDQTQPFFSIFNYTTSHESRVNDADRYRDAIKNLPETALKKPGEVSPPPYFPSTPDVEELWSRYYNIITAMDQQVGDLLLQLQEDGLSENTIVIFYSDHGAGVPRHKRWLYDSGLQIPMVVHMPAKYESMCPHPMSSTTDELVSFVDLAPTLLNLIDYRIPEYMQGRSFLGHNLTAEREYVYAGRDRMDERYDMQRAVRDKRFKYIRYYQADLPYCQYMNTPEKGAIMQAIRNAESDGTLPEEGQHMIQKVKPQEELFDCINDPLELNNLAGDPEYAAILIKMRQAHGLWSDNTKDSGLIPETIIRKWEEEKDQSIYEIMRKEKVPVGLIRQIALDDLPVETLLNHVMHRNEAVQYWAVQQLIKKELSENDINELRIVPFASPVGQNAFAELLCRHDNLQQGLTLLSIGLKHHDSWVRLDAALRLDQLDELARSSILALEGVMQDENKYVVRVANRALNQLLGTDNVVK